MVYTVREAVGFAAFLVGAAALTAVNHHPDHGRRTELERAAVEAAAARVAHGQIAAAWTQMKLGRPAPLDSVEAAFPLPLRATYEEGVGIVLTFDGHDDTCIDLVSREDSRRVTARDC
jgi:hypothetical protein